jgi:hypothetical protein
VRDHRDENDEVIGRIVEELRVLPAVPADATARVLARVDAAHRGEGPSGDESSDDDVIFFPTSTDEMRVSPARGEPGIAAVSGGPPTPSGRGPRRFMVSLPAAVGYALAATLAGFLIRGGLPRASSDVTVAATTEPVAAESLGGRVRVVAAAVSRRELQEAPVKVQFVLDAKRARSVTLVGDFNAWDRSATPLERDSTTGVWTALVDVRPGRHLYAFLVDGTVWTLDPNAPRVKDSDYGTEQSVMIVGLP